MLLKVTFDISKATNSLIVCFSVHFGSFLIDRFVDVVEVMHAKVDDFDNDEKKSHWQTVGHPDEVGERNSLKNGKFNYRFTEFLWIIKFWIKDAKIKLNDLYAYLCAL